MSDLIDRQILKESIEKLYQCDWKVVRDTMFIAQAIDDLPSAEPERKKGKWQRRKGSDCWECSECHAVMEIDDFVRHNFYYCYHCGADMMNEDGYMKLEGTEHE